jgi:hypothetical protein
VAPDCGVKLGHDGFDLLLRLLEARELRFTRSALDYHGGRAEALVSSGLLVPSGFERAVTCDGDPGLLPVEMDQMRGQLGYYSHLNGWVDVQKERLQLYRPDLAFIFQTLLGTRLRPVPSGPQECEPTLLWQLGDASLQRTGRTNVFFARRLGDRASVDRIQQALSRRPSDKLGIVLTSTPQNPLPDRSLPMMRVVPIADVLSVFEPVVIDMFALKARFAGTAAEAVSKPLHLSEDGRTLTINGNVELRFTGEVQQKAIRLLVKAHNSGKALKAADIIEKSGSGASSLDQVFRTKWAKLRPLLKNEDGRWRFDL